jgi:hypothetical protein
MGWKVEVDIYPTGDWELDADLGRQLPVGKHGWEARLYLKKEIVGDSAATGDEALAKLLELVESGGWVETAQPIAPIVE